MSKLFTEGIYSDSTNIPIVNTLLSRNTTADVSLSQLYDAGVVFIPEHIYNHIKGTGITMLEDSYKYLSYQDMADLVLVNERYAYSDRMLTIIGKAPDAYKRNVEITLVTTRLVSGDDHKDAYLIQDYNPDVESNNNGNLYTIKTIGSDIVIVVKPGMSRLLSNSKQKISFLKELCDKSFDVLNEVTTYRQPFFKELVNLVSR